MIAGRLVATGWLIDLENLTRLGQKTWITLRFGFFGQVSTIIVKFWDFELAKFSIDTLYYFSVCWPVLWVSCRTITENSCFPLNGPDISLPHCSLKRNFIVFNIDRRSGL
jgi:hypothetical protein